jgi:uncharacterized protein (DUF2249 family)
MQVYVASKFENSKEVQEAHKAFIEEGWKITHDWTVENADGMTGPALEYYLRECAKKDYEGVLRCDAFVLIHYEKGAGMFTELGIALASGKTVVIIDGHNPTKISNIFFHLPGICHVNTLKQAVEVLRITAKNVADRKREWT